MVFGNFRECDLVLVLKCIASAEALRATSNFRTFTNIQLYNVLGGMGMVGVSDVLISCCPCGIKVALAFNQTSSLHFMMRRVFSFEATALCTLDNRLHYFRSNILIYNRARIHDIKYFHFLQCKDISNFYKGIGFI